MPSTLINDVAVFDDIWFPDRISSSWVWVEDDSWLLERTFNKVSVESVGMLFCATIVARIVWTFVEKFEFEIRLIISDAFNWVVVVSIVVSFNKINNNINNKFENI